MLTICLPLNPEAVVQKRVTVGAVIAFFKKQQKLIEKQIKDLVKSDKDLDDRIKKIITAKGIGFQTAVTVIGETNGFELIQKSHGNCCMNILEQIVSNKLKEVEVNKINKPIHQLQGSDFFGRSCFSLRNKLQKQAGTLRRKWEKD